MKDLRLFVMVGAGIRLLLLRVHHLRTRIIRETVWRREKCALCVGFPTMGIDGRPTVSCMHIERC